MAEYSWHRHLIERGAYADWVDRGRLRPTHRQWSMYLREVAAKAQAEIVPGAVAGLEAAGGRWRLVLTSGQALWADGVVVTGAGPPVTIAGQPDKHPRVLDGAHLLAARERDQPGHRAERLRDRQRRDRRLDRHQPGLQAGQGTR